MPSPLFASISGSVPHPFLQRGLANPYLRKRFYLKKKGVWPIAVSLIVFSALMALGSDYSNAFSVVSYFCDLL